MQRSLRGYGERFRENLTEIGAYREKSMKIYRHAHKFYFIKNASALPRRRENQTKGKAGPAEGWALKVGCHQRADQAEYTAAQKQR